MTVVSLEIRVASAAVSLGLRAADAGKVSLEASWETALNGIICAVFDFAFTPRDSLT